MKFCDVDYRNSRYAEKEVGWERGVWINCHNRLSEGERIQKHPSRVDMVCLYDKEKCDFRWWNWLNKENKAVNLNVVGEMISTRRGMRTLDGQKHWSEVQYGEGEREGTTNHVFTLPSTCDQMLWVHPISRKSSPESLRGVCHQFRISNSSFIWNEHGLMAWTLH